MRERIKSIESILSAVDPDLEVAEMNADGTYKNKNQTLLVITTGLFTAFVIAEIIGALAGNSLALLGDASAMSVDVFAYLCSWYGERVKARNNGVLDEFSRMLVEVYIPCFSLVALLAVSGWVASGRTLYYVDNICVCEILQLDCFVPSDAVTILLEPHGVEDDVSVVYLFAFAGANMLVSCRGFELLHFPLRYSCTTICFSQQIDIISMALFYLQRNEVFKKIPNKQSKKRSGPGNSKTDKFIHGSDNDPSDHSIESLQGLSMATEALLRIDEEEAEVMSQIERQRHLTESMADRVNNSNSSSSKHNSSRPADDMEYSVAPPKQAEFDGESHHAHPFNSFGGTQSPRSKSENATHHVDINMASALTHVGGDSMRTVAVFISAVIASCGVNGTLCDAWATTIVTFSIVCMVYPLSVEIFKAARKHRKIKRSGKDTYGYNKLYKEGYARTPMADEDDVGRSSSSSYGSAQEQLRQPN
jgi:Co/Zn/Cd efflux system component